MLSRVHSVGLKGIRGYPVVVELDMANGLPGYATVGLPDSAIRESRERVSSAVRNSGYEFPARKITVNLAPAQARKEGTHYDLPIALAVLAASGQIEGEAWASKYCFIGELALDGSLRAVAGVLSMALEAKQRGFESIVVPQANAAEARSAGIGVVGGRSLREVAEMIGGQLPPPDLAESSTSAAPSSSGSEDLADVKGQAAARRALEIAAAGGHNIVLIGPPGTGKSMLARRLPTILPPMTQDEALEITRIHSAAGRPGMAVQRPFRSPHHGATVASMVGGGAQPRPGEASLAHGGVLFLDELGEFDRRVLEALRQPLEEGRLVVTRLKDVVEYPARFLLAAAANPCPCGWRGHARRACVCTPQAFQRYLSRFSGPLMDRIDLQVEMSSVDFSDWARAPKTESSAAVLERVLRARTVQRERFQGAAGVDGLPALNSGLGPGQVLKWCSLDKKAMALLEAAAKASAISTRGVERMLKVARTIADLEGSATVKDAHIGEAVFYRCLDRASERMGSI